MAGSIDLDTAVHHQGPGNQDAVGRGDGTMALIGAHMTGPGAEGAAPVHRVALIAGMAKILRRRHVWDMFGQHVRVAAITVAGQDNGLAADLFHPAIGAFKAQARDPAVFAGEQLRHLGVDHDVNLRRLRRAEQTGHQIGTLAGRRCVHARGGKARI